MTTTRRGFLQTSAGGLAAATLWQSGCAYDGKGALSRFAGIHGVGEATLHFTESGDVLELRPDDNRLLRRQSDGTLLWQIGEYGDGPGQLNYPTALVADHDGQIYVADAGNSRVQVYGPDGAYLRQVGGRAPGEADDPLELDYCRALVLDSAQRLYVCDTNDNHIQVFERDGTPAGSFGEASQLAAGLNRPIDLAIDGDDLLHVVDQGNQSVSVFDRNGGHLRSYGAYGSGRGQFILPRAVAVDSSGRSYVADAASFRIVVFGPDGQPIDDDLVVRFDDLRLGSPLDLVWAPGERLYVTAVRTTLT